MLAAFDADLIIAGAGPAGLSLAAALADAPVRILILERAPLSSLSSPAFDGREIALTHGSMRRLRQLGVWERLAPHDIASLKQARVFNGQSTFTLQFNNARHGEALGALVPNATIRRALFDAVREQGNCTVMADCAVIAIQASAGHVEVQTTGDRRFRAHLAVAADTRFSPLRQSQGISARMTDFGKSMLVCRMSHSTPHEQVATEWFGWGQTIAMLPLRENLSSFVLTAPSRETGALMELSPEAFSSEAQRRAQGKWGAMSLASTRHVYPLVAVYADRFAASRFALVGDAAVGMHPVTAHGYNLGLIGAMTLAAEIRQAAKQGADIGQPIGLLRYERAHRRATWPLFAATNAIAKLYTDERLLARIARPAGLRAMRAAAPIRRAIEARLSA